MVGVGVGVKIEVLEMFVVEDIFIHDYNCSPGYWHYVISPTIIDLFLDFLEDLYSWQYSTLSYAWTLAEVLVGGQWWVYVRHIVDQLNIPIIKVSKYDLKVYEK